MTFNPVPRFGFQNPKQGRFVFSFRVCMVVRKCPSMGPKSLGYRTWGPNLAAQASHKPLALSARAPTGRPDRRCACLAAPAPARPHSPQNHFKAADCPNYPDTSETKQRSAGPASAPTAPNSAQDRFKAADCPNRALITGMNHPPSVITRMNHAP